MRGKNINSSSHYGNFQWSEAVKALAILCLATACKQSAELSGYKGSLACSLDYAISKPPQWMQDLFGFDTQKNLIAKRIFLRINSEGKLQGPTTISISSAQLSEKDIEIFLGEKKLLKHEIEFLKERLELSLGGNAKNIRQEKPFYDLLLPIFKLECASRLADSFNFNRLELQKKLKAFSLNRSAKAISGRSEEVLQQLSVSLDSNTRLGIDSCDLISSHLKSKEIEFACTAVQGAVLAIATYLKNNQLPSLLINSRFAYATSLVNSIIAHEYEPDFVCAGFGPAMKLLSSRPDTYQAFMLAPDLSHRIISTDNKVQTCSGEYLITAEEPNTSTFCYDSLSQQGIINSRRTEILHMEPDEIYFAFQSGERNLKSLLWFPHYQLQVNRNNASLLGPQNHTEYNQSILILAHKKFSSQPKKLQAMRIAISNAWLNLRQPEKLDITLKAALSNTVYLSDLQRFTGYI